MTRTGNVYIGTASELPNPSSVDLRPGIFFVASDTGTTYMLNYSSGTKAWYAVGTAAEYHF